MRRTITYQVPGAPSTEPGKRDNGKTFLITEMPADQAERWLTQIGYLIARAKGIELDPDNQGLAAIMAVNPDLSKVGQLRALQDPSVDADTWSCVQYVHGPKIPPAPILSGADSQIEEVRTRALLRNEVLQLHSNFTEESPSTSAPSAAPKT
jgi:hypothetical protein